MELNKNKYHQFLVKVLNKVHLTNSFYVIPEENSFFQIISEELSTGVKIFYDSFKLEIPVLIEKILNTIKELDDINGINENIFIIDSDLSGILENLYDIIEASSDFEIQIWDINVIKSHFEKFKLVKEQELLKNKPSEFLLTQFSSSKKINKKIFIDSFEQIDNVFFKNKHQVCVLFSEYFGSGKTVAATEYALSNKSKFKHLAYIKKTNDLRVDFLDSFNNYLNKSTLQFSYNFADNIFFNFYKLVEIISLLDQNSLIILDGIDMKKDIAIIRDILRELKFKVLIVSNKKLKDFNTVELICGSKKNVQEVFRTFVPNFQQLLFDEIFDKVENNLLLVNFIGRQIKINDGINLDIIHKSIKSTNSKVYQIGKYISDDLSAKGVAVNKYLFKSIMSIFELQVKSFNLMQKIILTTFSVLPDIKITLTDLQNLLKISNSKIDDFVDSVLDLHNKGWLTLEGKNIYVNELIRKVLHKKLKPKASVLKPVITYINSNLNNEEFNVNFLVLWNISFNILNNITSFSKDLVDLAESTAEFSEDLGYWDIATEFYDTACVMYESILKSANLNYNSLLRLSNLAFKSNDFEKALYYSQLLIDQSEIEFGLESEEIANVFIQIALIYDQLEDYSSAIEFITEAIDILELFFSPEDEPMRHIKELHEEFSNKYRAHEFEINIKDFIERFYDDSDDES